MEPGRWGGGDIRAKVSIVIFHLLSVIWIPTSLLGAAAHVSCLYFALLRKHAFILTGLQRREKGKIKR